MKPVKVVSLNLWLGGNLLAGILEFLQAEKPDILLIQEAYNATDSQLEDRFRSLEVLQRRLQLPASDFAAMYLEKLPFGKLERGNAVLSKFPVKRKGEWWLYGQYCEYVDTQENYLTAPRNLQHVGVDVAGTELNIFNFQGVCDLDGENDSEARLEMSRVIVEATMDKPNVILGGDTNVRPNTQTIRNIEEHLKNVFKDELTTTFNMRRKTNPGYATSVVDMLFVSPNIHVLQHYCPGVDISDHLPLVATLQIAS